MWAVLSMQNPGLGLYITLSIVAFLEEWKTIIIYTFVLFVGFLQWTCASLKTLP